MNHRCFSVEERSEVMDCNPLSHCSDAAVAGSSVWGPDVLHRAVEAAPSIQWTH